MQWILQDFEDTRLLAAVLGRLKLPFTMHKVVPFIGALEPEPEVLDPGNVILFGSYAMRHVAAARGWTPGVITIRPFVHEAAWAPSLLNGPDAVFLQLSDIPAQIAPDDRAWFVRPVDDSKAEPGRVQSGAEIVGTAERVLSIPQDEIPIGSLRSDTDLMLCPPRRIRKEWRCWIVDDVLVTASLYKEGRRVVYRPEMDDDARAFVAALVAANPGYAAAYVLDVCRTEDGLFLLETNCINAAGFYAADLLALVRALEDLADRCV